ncbi:UNVERIFIED_CONTAM: hypothetical protein FKN15_007270 [Acipenser sinensis]
MQQLQAADPELGTVMARQIEDWRPTWEEVLPVTYSTPPNGTTNPFDMCGWYLFCLGVGPQSSPALPQRAREMATGDSAGMDH